MARGDPSCERFCDKCRCDCKCEASDCNICHTCRDYTIHSGGCVIREHVGCRSYTHDCGKPLMNDILTKKLNKFPSLFSTELVDIKIGKGKETIYRRVPKDALVEHSLYFKTAVSFDDGKHTKGFTFEVEGLGALNLKNIPASPPPDPQTPEETAEPSLQIELNEDVDRPVAFDMFIQYLYWQDYRPPPPTRANHVLGDIDIRSHAQVYVLAERLMADGLKDLALRYATEMLVRVSKHFRNGKNREDSQTCISLLPEVIIDIYQHTPDRSSDVDGEAGDKANTQTEGTPETDEESTETNSVVDSTHQKEGNGAFKPIKEPFRNLLAATSAACLDEMKKLGGFRDCIFNIPEFAVDFAFHVSQGVALEVGKEGYLKEQS